MRVRSLDELDQAKSWRRLLVWARRRMEVPDRLPFETADRLYPSGPRLLADHHVQPQTLVMGTKGSGTVRPFVRLPVMDIFLYQALVEALGEAIEGVLGPRDKVFAYRQTLDDTQDDQFSGSPRWSDFNSAARARMEADPDAYCLRADIAGYFMQLDVDELERSLLQLGVLGNVIRDLGELLRMWRSLGVRGLPQGIPASSPLGNFFLTPLDQNLDDVGLDYLRYMDDVWVFTDTFSSARRAQDLIERVLYDMGLSLSGEKSRPLHRQTALANARTAEEVLDGHRELFREGWEAMLSESYIDDAELPPDRDINEAAVLDLYSDTVAALRAGEYPEGFRRILKNIYRELRDAGQPSVIGDVPELVNRFPDLTHDAALYLGYTASGEPAAAVAALGQLLDPARFLREQELLEVFRAVLFVPARTLGDQLPNRFAALALNHEHPLVRARALLAWGAHSAVDDFTTADDFWRSCAQTWRIYPFVAIQDKVDAERDHRFGLWSAEGRFLEQLGESIRVQRFSWRKV